MASKTTTTPAVAVSTDTRRTIRASVTAATALDKASGKFSKASAIALLTIVDELGVGKDAGTVWTDTVAAYGEHILKPASGRAYLSHVRKAHKMGKTTTDILDYLGLDTDTPRGLSSLGAWLKDEDKTKGAGGERTPEEILDTIEHKRTTDMETLMARAIKALETVSDAMGDGITLDGDQWAAFKRIAAGIERKATPKPATVAAKTTGKPATVAAKV